MFNILRNLRRRTEPRNPDGLTQEEFINNHKSIENIARICWFFGVYPEELKIELERLLGR